MQHILGAFPLPLAESYHIRGSVKKKWWCCSFLFAMPQTTAFLSSQGFSSRMSYYWYRTSDLAIPSQRKAEGIPRSAEPSRALVGWTLARMLNELSCFFSSCPDHDLRWSGLELSITPQIPILIDLLSGVPLPMVAMDGWQASKPILFLHRLVRPTRGKDSRREKSHPPRELLDLTGPLTFAVCITVQGGATKSLS